MKSWEATVKGVKSHHWWQFGRQWAPLIAGSALLTILVLGGGWYGYQQYSGLYRKVNAQEEEKSSLGKILDQLQGNKGELESQLASISAELEALKAVDQKVKNDQLQKDIKELEVSFKAAVDAYEDLVKLREQTNKTADYDNAFTKALVLLGQRNYASGSAQIKKLQADIKAQQDKLAATAAVATIPANVKESNAAPGSGYSRQKVVSPVGTFLVDLVAADLGNTRVIVDTASAGDCRNDCPALPLGDYVARNGAFAGINGSYFCPVSYPSCAGKTNSFDTLLMNKNKVYFNSENNVYSAVPAVIFGSGYIRFLGASRDWGRDTGIDSMIANYPLVVTGGNVAFGGNGDPKLGSRGNRSFVAHRGNVVYIGVVHGVTVAESAHVLKTLGMDDALNLDSGGSTALWSGGYKAGPGRNIPNVILFVRK